MVSTGAAKQKVLISHLISTVLLESSFSGLMCIEILYKMFTHRVVLKVMLMFRECLYKFMTTITWGIP